MTAKTLGVVLVSVLAIFTAFYWITDTQRRDQRYEDLQTELVEYGEIMFGPPTADHPATANCAQCHGAEGEGGDVGRTGVRAPNLHSRSLFEKLQANPNYVNLVIRFGGVVVSGNVNSLMPAWSTEVGGPLTIEQVDALTALVESWATGAGEQPQEEVPDTAEAGQEVYQTAGCAGCHGQDLAGNETYPGLQNIGNEPITNEELPTPVSQEEQLIADYEEDPRRMLELWIRDSAGNYNDGEPTGMPPHPEEQLPEDALQALITFLLEQRAQ
ncbi:MAG TPA: c-type cytochrome [Candidatus Limnocylindria bacterium]|nr:c-type cytochrome [Candidatus Limnocylindria bacterium]